MNIFISQPMRGKTTEQIEWEREELVKEFKEYFKRNVNILGTVFHFTEDVPALVYLARSIEVLAKADLAVFMDGWEDARGCRIEHECAKEYLIPTLELNGDWYPVT